MLVICFVIAITVHEWAHAWVATILGDPTPRIDGRLTLDPIAHLDLFGSLMLLIVGFGWGKPVDVTPSYFHYPKRDFALVALAGPVSNIVLAFVMLVGLLFVPVSLSDTLFISFAEIFVMINILLAIFNMIPLPPLDGGNILTQFLPRSWSAWLWQYGMLILFVLIGVQMFFHVDTIAYWVRYTSTITLDILQGAVLGLANLIF